jgi:putative Mg2+ transporter-C (MgtC) family protein
MVTKSSAMLISFDILLKLALSILVGGIIGAEREYQNKSAGLRTMILISLGSAIFTLISVQISGTLSPDRIASNIVTGIGFVGAGVIFKSDTGVAGITTAATIWVTASLGMAIGAGCAWIAFAGCILLLPILYTFTYIERWMDKLNRLHVYKIVCTYEKDIAARYEQLFQAHGLKCSNGLFRRDGNHFSATWTVQGANSSHQQVIQKILNDPAVTSFEW